MTSSGSRYKQENFQSCSSQSRTVSSETENILSVNLYSFLEINDTQTFLWSCNFQNPLVKIQNCIVHFLINELWDPHISSTRIRVVEAYIKFELSSLADIKWLLGVFWCLKQQGMHIFNCWSKERGYSVQNQVMIQKSDTFSIKPRGFFLI